MNKLHVKTGDTVVLLTGKKEVRFSKIDEKSGKKEKRTGTVLEVSSKEGKVIVEGMNLVTKHMKPRRQGEIGSIVKAEAPIYACKVQLVCPKCKQPTRVGTVIEDGKKLRSCKKCGATFK